MYQHFSQSTSTLANSNTYTLPKNKFKFFICSIRKNIIPITFFLFCICLILFSTTNLIAVKNALYLWATAVIPSLFPFFVATELLSYTNIINILGKYLNFIMRPLFGVPGEAGFAFLMGLISGYPVGAKIVSNLYEENKCTKEEAERMIAFTNNSGPLFIIGTVGISLFGNSMIGILLFITHVLACISVGILLNIIHNSHSKNSKISFSNSYKATNAPNKNVSFSSLGEVLGKSITNSISTILLIGGFVVIFSVIISIFNQSHLLDAISNLLKPVISIFNIPSTLIKPFLSGIIELTNGVNLVANLHFKEISLNIIVCAFLLGFGGFSILLQVFSIISKNGLSIRKYFIGKLFQAIFASFYTYLALQFLPFFHFNLY